MSWSRGLLLAGILIVIGAMAVVSSRSVRDRCFSIAALVQGIVVLFAVSGAFHQRSDLGALSVALMLVCGLWCLWDRDLSPVPPLEHETELSTRVSLNEDSLATEDPSIASEHDSSEGLG